MVENGNSIFSLPQAVGDAFGLGDINHDGYDDYAFNNDEETEDRAGLLIFFGAPTSPLTGELKSVADADIRVQRLEAGQLPGGLKVSGELKATAGDFNGDGKQDLAVFEGARVIESADGALLDIDTLPRISLFYSVVEKAQTSGGRLSLTQPDAQLLGEQNLSIFDFGADARASFPGSSELDLDRDGVDDLVLGLGAVDVLGNTLIDEAGRATRSTARTASCQCLARRGRCHW